MWMNIFWFGCTTPGRPSPALPRPASSLPGLQRYVAVQDPAVVEMHGVLRAAWRGWGSRTRLAAGCQGPPLKRVRGGQRLPAAGARVGWRRGWRERSEGELVAWAPWHLWNGKESGRHEERQSWGTLPTTAEKQHCRGRLPGATGRCWRERNWLLGRLGGQHSLQVHHCSTALGPPATQGTVLTCAGAGGLHGIRHRLGAAWSFVGQGPLPRRRCQPLQGASQICTCHSPGAHPSKPRGPNCGHAAWGRELGCRMAQTLKS